jgi:hypothetical protein
MLTTFALVSPPTQSNDAKLLTFTDASATWVSEEALPTPEGNYLTLDIVIKTYDETLVCDTITYPGPYTLTSQLVFEIGCDDLLVSGAAIGTATDMLSDGIYEVTYNLYDNGDSLLNSYTTTLVILGQIEIDMANDFADVPAVWRRKELSLQSDDVLALIQPLQKEAYYQAILAEPYETRETAILNIIDDLNSLIDD